MAKMTIKEVVKILTQMDKNLKPKTTDWNCAMILLSSAFVGPKIKTLEQ